MISPGSGGRPACRLKEAGGLPAMRKLVPNFRVARDPLGTELFYIPRTPFSIRPRT